MNRRRLILAVAALVAIALVWSWWSSDRRRIGSRVERLEELVAKSGPENALAGLAAARAITDLFAPSFEVRAEQLGFRTRDRRELARFIHAHRSSHEEIRMRVSSSSLFLGPEPGRATQNASLVFGSGGPLGSSSESYRVLIGWLLEDGRWSIDYVDLVEIVE